jgi:hypothetical protein
MYLFLCKETKITAENVSLRGFKYVIPIFLVAKPARTPRLIVTCMKPTMSMNINLIMTSMNWFGINFNKGNLSIC